MQVFDAAGIWEGDGGHCWRSLSGLRWHAEGWPRPRVLPSPEEPLAHSQSHLVSLTHMLHLEDTSEVVLTAYQGPQLEGTSGFVSRAR